MTDDTNEFQTFNRFFLCVCRCRISSNTQRNSYTVSSVCSFCYFSDRNEGITGAHEQDSLTPTVNKIKWDGFHLMTLEMSLLSVLKLSDQSEFHCEAPTGPEWLLLPPPEHRQAVRAEAALRQSFYNRLF